MISIIADNKEIPIQWLEFSDGALTCKIDTSITNAKNYISVSVCPSTPVKQIREELWLIESVIVELRDLFTNNVPINLYIPYLPYGRADRVFEKGNPNPLEYFLMYLKEFYYYDKIYVCDPHSLKLIKRFIPDKKIEIKTQFQCLLDSLTSQHMNWDYVVSPDKGAITKATDIAKYFNCTLVTANKVRDVSTGKILSVELTENIPFGSKVLIPDDILDGGGTFIPLAETLKENNCTVDLYITHLIASKGLKIFKGKIDKIYNYQIVGKFINKLDVQHFNERKI